MSIPGPEKIGSAPSCDNHTATAWLAAMLNTSDIPDGSLAASNYVHDEEYPEPDLRGSPALEREILPADEETTPGTSSDAVVEVEDHPLSGQDGESNVRFSGGNAEVRYWNNNCRRHEWKVVSLDGDGQYRAATSFIRGEIEVEPHTRKLFLFSRLVKSDLPGYPYKLLASDSIFHAFVEKLAVSFSINSRSQGSKPFLQTLYWSRPASLIEQAYRIIESLLENSYPTSASAQASTAQRMPVDSQPHPAVAPLQPSRIRRIVRQIGSTLLVIAIIAVAPIIGAVWLIRVLFGSKLALITVPVSFGLLLHLYLPHFYARPGSAAATPAAALTSAASLHLCSSDSPGLPCISGSAFRPGATVEVQLGPTQGSLVSLRVREPKGRVLAPALLRTTLPEAGQEVPVARFTLPRHKATGIYTVSLRLRPAQGSGERDQTLTRDFIVASEGSRGRHNPSHEKSSMLK